MINPFGRNDPNMGLCKPPPSDCPCYQRVCPIVPLDNGPGNRPALADARGRLILINGRKDHGKTVFGHQLLHGFRGEGAQPVDLMWDVSRDQLDDTYRELVVQQLEARLIQQSGDFIRPEANGQAHPAVLSDRLLNVMKMANGRDLVIRLPVINQSALVTQDEIWKDLTEYASAARRSENVLIWEHRGGVWPDHWLTLQRLIEKDHTLPVICLEMKPPSRQLVHDYVRAVIGLHAVDGRPSSPFLEEAAERELLSLLPADPYVYGMAWVNKIMKAAFDEAIRSCESSVTALHMLRAVFSCGGPF